MKLKTEITKVVNSTEIEFAASVIIAVLGGTWQWPEMCFPVSSVLWIQVCHLEQYKLSHFIF